MKVATSPTSLPNLLILLWHHLSRRRKRQFGLLMGLVLFSAFAEVITLGAVLPFLGILIVPERVFNYPIVTDLAHALGITSADQLVLPLTVTFITLAMIAGAIRILLLWANIRLAVFSGADLSTEVYRRTLYQSYQVHVACNSSGVISNITNKINSVVFGVLLPFLTLVTSMVLLGSIMLVLIAIDPIVAVVATLGFGASYAFITWITRRQLYRNSQLITNKQTKVVKALQEGLGGIRDVLLDGTQSIYCDIYRQADYPLRQALGLNAFISGSPRPAMEAVGIVLITALAYALSRQVGGVATALPVLGALALGAQRLLPAMQQAYGAWASIASNKSALADTIARLEQPIPFELLQPDISPLVFQKDIQFQGVRFRYADDTPWVLDRLNLIIPKGSRVGFVGSTGSGKSTTLDLLMGLLVPTEGLIMVDDQPIKGSRVVSWQRSIAHVPQSIFLSDSTLAENIAFGVPSNAIDLNRVRQVARQAQIADFIESRPEGYQAYVGERGIRLSGGQRQRIGIARALYKRASVLVLDEATSALDNVTEQSVIDAIEGISGDLTILFITHRLSTVERCDIVVEMEHGRVVAQGTYTELLERSPSFRRMAKVI